MNPRLHRAHTTARPDAGLSLVEVLIAVAVMTMGFLALAQTVVTTHALKQNSDERHTLLNAFRVVGEEMRGVAEEAREVPAQWAATVLDAMRPGGLLGPQFGVRGLDPQSGEPEVGSIRVVTDETLTDAELGLPMGMPRDLDADGRADATDVTATASLLPVVVTLRWSGQAGDRELRRGFFLTQF